MQSGSGLPRDFIWLVTSPSAPPGPGAAQAVARAAGPTTPRRAMGLGQCSGRTQLPGRPGGSGSGSVSFGLPLPVLLL